MKKLLYIAPHLSTGGMPQYLLKQIETFKDDLDIEVIEYDNISNDFTVQRDKIRKLVSLKTLGIDKKKIFDYINQFNPDFIHFQEIPDNFIGFNILSTIFRKDRPYYILTTTHSSHTSVDRMNTLFYPDIFIAVSEWSKKVLEGTGVKCEVWEYPIERKGRMKKNTFGYKPMILNVGLFTPGKNQGELFQIAKLLPEYDFFFVGNQADNFKEYWEPLMKNKPDNCYIWGEQRNVNEFYNEADLFYFPSKEELMPIVLKEAAGYGLPILCYRLPTYSNEFTDLHIAHFLDNFAIQEKVNLIKTFIDNDKLTPPPTENIYSKFWLKPLPPIFAETDEKVRTESFQTKNEPIINYHFGDGAYVEILSKTPAKFTITFYDGNTGYRPTQEESTILYQTTITNNSWAKCNIKYFVNWKIIITKENDVSFYKEIKLDLKDKRVLIDIQSSSLGDTLAWFPYVEEFRRKHKCKVFASTAFNNLFNKNYYNNIEFVPFGTALDNLEAIYRIGWFYNGDEIDLQRNPTDPKPQPMQKTASDILDLDYKEIKPIILLPYVKHKKNKVCLGIHSTAQAKYWNHENGWQVVSDYIKSIGYQPLILSKEENGYMGNYYPVDVYRLPEGPIEEVIKVLCESELYIGTGSGLSWLAWACDVPVILISGFSKSYTEMSDCIRIDTPEYEDICTGCFNRYKLDAGDWNWCPVHKDDIRRFECSKSISPMKVIEAIKTVIK